MRGEEKTRGQDTHWLLLERQRLKQLGSTSSLKKSSTSSCSARFSSAAGAAIPQVCRETSCRQDTTVCAVRGSRASYPVLSRVGTHFSLSRLSNKDGGGAASRTSTPLVVSRTANPRREDER